MERKNYQCVPPTYATQLVAYKKKIIKAKRLILDGVKDHVIPHVRGKDQPLKFGQL